MSKGIGITGIITIVLSILAAVITKDIWIGLSVLVIGLILNLIAFLSIIPIVGVVAQYILAKMAMAKLLTMLVIPASIIWITTVLFWVSILSGIFVTVLVLTWIIGYIASR